MAAPMIFCLGLGSFLRWMLFKTPCAQWLATRQEAVTPLTSWKRVVEGVSLYSQGISPYKGDLFHEPPLMLRFFDFVVTVMPGYLDLFFIVMDVVIAVVLYDTVHWYGRYLLKRQDREAKTYASDVKPLLLKSSDLFWTKTKIVALYLFNPYTIAVCLAKSTSVFNNLAIALVFLFTLKGQRFGAAFFVAIAGYLSLYPLMLALPVAIFMLQREGKVTNYFSPSSLNDMSKTFTAVAAPFCALLLMSYHLEGSCDFLKSTYGFILTVPDLTPNTGVFWYFFTEMFEHFRVFFLWVFQIHVFIYTVPLGVKLRDHPIFLMYVLTTIISIFKSYPSYGDASLYLSMLPMWSYVYQYVRNSLVVTCMFVCSTVLAPILWHLWIYAGSANANFYFAITLVYSAGQIFLITDVVFAFLRREFHLINGCEPKLENGTKAEVEIR
ncbi:phosphatidylinositol glycan anchor biosynthesis class U protein-like [Lineus longissimus]|uniref:phosphatidylinositol glycan anchor biosynthesis class U protein-like n=1 Tax=Lineus longissimus TaxID=88925 RepID=UPI002B4F208D